MSKEGDIRQGAEFGEILSGGCFYFSFCFEKYEQNAKCQGRSYLFIIETILLKIHPFLLEAGGTKNSRHTGRGSEQGRGRLGRPLNAPIFKR